MSRSRLARRPHASKASSMATCGPGFPRRWRGRNWGGGSSTATPCAVNRERAAGRACVHLRRRATGSIPQRLVTLQSQLGELLVRAAQQRGTDVEVAGGVERGHEGKMIAGGVRVAAHVNRVVVDGRFRAGVDDPGGPE